MKKTTILFILCVMLLISACADTTPSGENQQDSTPPVTDDNLDATLSGDGDTPDKPAPDVPSADGDTEPNEGTADADTDAEPNVDDVQEPDVNAKPDDGTGDTGTDAEPNEGDTQEPSTDTQPDDGSSQEPNDDQPAVMDPNGIPAVYIATTQDTTITRSSYVDCSITIMDPTGTYDTIVDSDATIKVRGHSSSQGAKKPYNFKFSSKQELLGLGEGKKWCLLANMYDKTQMRNQLAYEFADDIGMPYIQSSTFVDVYLNGEYCGLYQLSEPVDVDETKVDIDPDNNEFLLEIEPSAGYSNDAWITSPYYGFILGYNEPEEPTDDQRAYLKEFLRTAETAMSSGNYEEICKYVDVDSFANAYIVQELFKQVDYHTTSTRFYVKEGKLYEGPVWDFDLSSGNCSSYLYPDYHNKSTTGLSWQGLHCVGIYNQYLFRCDEFKALVASKLTKFQPIIVNLYEDNELGRSRIDAWLDEYRDDVERNNEIWTTKTAANSYEHTPVDGTYDGEIEFLRDWLKNRNAWLLDHYCPAE